MLMPSPTPANESNWPYKNQKHVIYTNKEVLRQLNFLLKHQDAQLFQASPTHIARRNDDESERKHDIVLTEIRTETKGGDVGS